MRNIVRLVLLAACVTAGLALPAALADPSNKTAAVTDNPPTPCRTQKKRDLLGFCPGMTVADVNAPLMTKGCTPYKAAGEQHLPCVVEDDGELGLLFSEHLSPPVLFQVHYHFKSGIYAEKMVERISKEFGARPLSSPTEIKVNIAGTMGRPVRVPILGTTAIATGGRVTDWDLGQGLRLMLDMDAGILGARDNTSYDLTLSSEKIRDKDMAVSAAEQEAKRAKARVNLNPKF